MPELPEVETICQGLLPHIKGKKITHVEIRHKQLRWPIPNNLAKIITGQTIKNLSRRAKYLLLKLQTGTVIIHLGMSGRLVLFPIDTPARIHDHVDFYINNKYCLRFRDPRRFGAILWTEEDPLQHILLKNLGPEPLTPDFNAQILFEKTRKNKKAIKLWLMDSQKVSGVGNIYANEALFVAKIHPQFPACQLSKADCQCLVTAIKAVLKKAIKKGGTTLKDFVGAHGMPGYFQQKLFVYGRENKPCRKCKTLLIDINLGQRSTVFCPKCQPAFVKR